MSSRRTFTGFSYPDIVDEKEKFLKTFDKLIIAIGVALNSLATLLDKIEDNWLLYEILMNHKNRIHSQIVVLIREKRNSLINPFFSCEFSTFEQKTVKSHSRTAFSKFLWRVLVTTIFQEFRP